MYRFLLTPRWLALHALAVAALVLFIVLGWWQFGVYQDSQGRQDTRQLDAVPIAQLAGPGTELGEAVDRQAVVEGTYLAEQQLIVPGRIHDNVLGSYVVTPLLTGDGVVVPVLRGWVDDPDEPATAAPEGAVTATGYLLPPETADHATVRTGQALDDGELAYIAPDQLDQRAGVAAADAIHGYLLLQDESPASASVPATLDVDVVAPIRDVNPWQNLSYWAQWWVFAVAAVVFWVSIVRSGLRARRTEVSEPVRSRVPS